MFKDNFSKEEYGKIISDMVKELDVPVPVISFDIPAVKSTFEYYKKQNWPTKMYEYAASLIPQTVLILQVVYPHLDEKTRLFVSRKSIIFILIDDLYEELGDSLYSFEANLTSRKPQDHPVLQTFADLIVQNVEYLGPFAGLRDTISNLQFIHSCIVERNFTKKLLPLPRGAVNFPRTFRGESSCTYEYASFAFPVSQFPSDRHFHKYFPIMNDFVILSAELNDILTFYKEAVIGKDQFIYILNVARVHDIPVMDAIRRVYNELIQHVQIVQNVLGDEPELLAAANAFIYGNFAWAFMNDYRHHLSDIPIFNDKGESIIGLYDDIREKMLNAIEEASNVQ